MLILDDKGVDATRYKAHEVVLKLQTPRWCPTPILHGSRSLHDVEYIARPDFGWDASPFTRFTHAPFLQ